jgi:spoIIIJ-associated protein
MDDVSNMQVSGSAPSAMEDRLSRMKVLLEQIIQLGRLNLHVTTRRAAPNSAEPDAPEWIVEFSGADSDLLLEAKAELLDALAYIVTKAVHIDEDSHHKILFDCRDYRQLRAQELKLTAHLAAERVIESGEPFALNPMNPLDRRMIHLALKDQPLVRTESQGMGSGRQVVILPSNKNE